MRCIMKHFLIFPYDRYIRRSLELASDRLNDSIEDVLSLSGWGWTGDEVFVKDTIICVKDDICKVSEKCDSIWITESYYAIDFEKFILPLNLSHCCCEHSLHGESYPQSPDQYQLHYPQP